MVMLKLLAVNGHSKSDVIAIDSSATGAELLAAIWDKFGWTFKAANFQNEGRARGKPLPLDLPLGDTLKDGATVTAQRNRGARPTTAAAAPARRAAATAAAPRSAAGSPRSRTRSSRSSGGSESSESSDNESASAEPDAPPRAAAAAPEAAPARAAAASSAAAPGVAGSSPRGAEADRLRKELAQARQEAAAAATALGERDAELATARAELAQARQEALDAEAAKERLETRSVHRVTAAKRARGEKFRLLRARAPGRTENRTCSARCAGLTTEGHRLTRETSELQAQVNYWATMYHGGQHVDGVDYPGKKELALQEQVALHQKNSAPGSARAIARAPGESPAQLLERLGTVRSEVRAQGSPSATGWRLRARSPQELHEKNARLLQENHELKLKAQACCSCSGRKGQDQARGKGGGGKGQGKPRHGPGSAGGAPGGAAQGAGGKAGGNAQAASTAPGKAAPGQASGKGPGKRGSAAESAGGAPSNGF
ncbi:unnamed protein product [Prorocentrum cordatum]|uniref:Rad60/SUMO-like domain-containing protein n=1 Tax=Prorocentrum cordatum TaxID=2364126 RepID=A0ABN9T8X7_9DINO|nr:unnamed protein product [Polarella glacialis]